MLSLTSLAELIIEHLGNYKALLVISIIAAPYLMKESLLFLSNRKTTSTKVSEQFFKDKHQVNTIEEALLYNVQKEKCIKSLLGINMKTDQIIIANYILEQEFMFWSKIQPLIPYLGLKNKKIVFRNELSLKIEAYYAFHMLIISAVLLILGFHHFFQFSISQKNYESLWIFLTLLFSSIIPAIFFSSIEKYNNYKRIKKEFGKITIEKTTLTKDKRNDKK